MAAKCMACLGDRKSSNLTIIEGLCWNQYKAKLERQIEAQITRSLENQAKEFVFYLQIMESYYGDSGDSEPNNGFKRDDLVLTITDGLKGSEAKRRKINRGDVF